MSSDLLTVSEETGILEVIDRMRSRGVRRVPVVNDAGGLVGILTVDDLLELIAEMVQGLVTLVGVEGEREERQRK